MPPQQSESNGDVKPSGSKSPQLQQSGDTSGKTVKTSVRQPRWYCVRLMRNTLILARMSGTNPAKLYKSARKAAESYARPPKITGFRMH